MWLLAADIGGTNTRFLAVSLTKPEKECAENYASKNYPDILTIIEEFTKKYSISEVQSACFAVAGPVLHGKAKITNLPWLIDCENILQQTGIMNLSLINDFSGVAWGVSVLKDNDYVTLQAAEPDPNGAIAIIGAGTGLGQAILVNNTKERIIVQSEGGHVDFAPRCTEEIELLIYWQSRLPRVTYETFLSGPGIGRLFVFYCDYLQQQPDGEFKSKMQTQDAAAVICEYAVKYKHPVATVALKRFVKIYAAQAANLALTCKSTGGVYIAGGIAPKIINMLQSDDFLNTFNDKSPMQALMASIPVRIIKNTNIGLMGALEVARSAVKPG